MSTNKASITPSKDPYVVLGLSFGASDAEIAKAYRNLARTLHPDKHVSQNLSQSEIAKKALRFQEIQTARTFLLDAEHVDARRKYDTKLASEQVRRAADNARELGMSERRKRMRAELQHNEEEAARNKLSKQAVSRRSTTERVTKDKLSREGMKMREQYAMNEAMTKQLERAKALMQLQNRQIRLKWSRTKLKLYSEPSPSEDSIAKMLSVSCGTIENVQMLGDKGNAALVTFEHEDSCPIAVDLYRTSETFRAVYVNKDRQREDEQKYVSAIHNKTSSRDQEDILDWKLRQENEREAMIRQMEGEILDNTGNGKTGMERMESLVHATPTTTSQFPTPFPNQYISNGVRSLDSLEQLENILLNGVVPDIVLQQMKV
jgi:DnaJ homolog subfamily C member 17